MNKFIKPFQVGKVILPNNVFYAPLAGCSDFPFRKMSGKYQPGIMFCEMVKMDALIRNDEGTFRMLDFDDSMRPIGGQLCGSKPEIAGQTARIIQDLGFDTIDLNCGCPVDKVTKDGSGSGMLKDPRRIGDVISNMVAAVDIPVTVKIRAGWDEENIVAAEVTRIAEEAGAQAICVHGRTRKQAYKGPANWDYIKASKDAARTIKVIGNGDAIDAQSVEKMFAYTGCDAVLVARGTMGAPWIVQDIIRHLEGKEAITRSIEDARQSLYEHFLHTLAYHNERRVCVDMRRVGCWYFKKAPGTRKFREQISRATDVNLVRDLILNFPIGEIFETGSVEEQGNEADCGDCES